MDNKKSKREKQNLNYYKITTMVLIAILVLVGVYFLYSIHISNVSQESQIYGQKQVINSMIQSVSQNGQVTFNLGENQSLTLVPVSAARQVRESTILEIFNYVEKEGAVTLYNNETELTLIPYEGNTQENIDASNLQVSQ
jgi:flagellar basal body-associated protein FliL